MIDHLLTFANETAAHTALKKLGFGSVDEESNVVWDRSRVDPGVKLILADAVWDNTDPENPVLVTPQQVVPGFHITISLPEASKALHATGAVQVVENRTKATRAKKFYEYAEPLEDMTAGIATDTKAEYFELKTGKIDKMKFRISPRFLGSDYPDPL